MLNVILLSVVISPSSCVALQDDLPVGQVAVNEAIDRGVQFLLSNQHLDGSWFVGPFAHYPHAEGGATGLCVAALLHSGLEPDHQAIVRGAAYARSRPMRMFYGAVTRILMEDVMGEDADEDHLKSLAEFVLGGSGSEYFDYPGKDKPDLSITQYAVLGMWMAKGDGIKIPDKPFERALKVILREQQSDGGWSYFGGGGHSQNESRPTSTCSMTTAGMSSLLFCLDALGERQKTAKKYREDVEEALERGHAWLDQHMSYEYNHRAGDNPDAERHWDLYYYYTIERLGTIAAREELGGKDWYEEGARHLLKTQLPAGGWVTSNNTAEGGNNLDAVAANSVTSTAFALLFLNKATASITGEGVKRKQRSIASPDPDNAPLDLRINLTKKPVLWVAQFSRDTLNAYGQKGKFGLRVEKVSYYLNDELVGEVLGDVERNSESGRFALVLDDIGAGKYEVKAVARVAPEPGDGFPVGDQRVEIQSPVLQMKVDWTMTAAQRLSLEELSANLIPGTNPTISVSSEQDASGEGSFAVDGTTATSWSPDESDSEPSIRLSWKRGIKAKTLVLTALQGSYTMSRRHANGETEVETYWDLARQIPTRVEVSINGKETEYELKGEAREHIDLGKTHTIKSLEIKILDTRPANDRARKGTGFSEIELIGKIKKRR